VEDVDEVYDTKPPAYSAWRACSHLCTYWTNGCLNHIL